MAVIRFSTGALVFTCLQFVVWAFAFVATPTAQFQTPGHGCYTMWGQRNFCGDIAYDKTGDDAFGCSTRTSHMQAAAAFAVISTVVTFAAFIFGFLFNTRLHRKIPTLPAFILCCVADVTCLICFACVAAVYNNEMCGDRMKDRKGVKYTAGFALMVAAWCMEIIATIVLGLTVLGTQIHSPPEGQKQQPEPLDHNDHHSEL